MLNATGCGGCACGFEEGSEPHTNTGRDQLNNSVCIVCVCVCRNVEGCVCMKESVCAYKLSEAVYQFACVAECLRAVNTSKVCNCVHRVNQHQSQ